jgi:spore coat protein U-like protein
MSCQGRTGELIHYRLRLTTGEGQYRLRLMHSGAAVLAYNLYLDAGRTQVWGDGSEGTTQASGTLRLTSPSYSGVYPVYARILSTAATAATAYADSIVVQLSY